MRSWLRGIQRHWMRRNMARKNQGRSVIAVGKPKAALTPPLSAEFFVNTRSPGFAPITPVTGGSGAFYCSRTNRLSRAAGTVVCFLTVMRRGTLCQ